MRWPGGTTGSPPRPAARSSWRRPRATGRRCAAFAEQPLLEVWYAHLDIEQAIGEFRSQIKAKRFKAAEKLLAKAHTRDSTQALGKLTTMVDGRRRIISDPPMIVPIEEVFPDVQAGAIYEQLRDVLGKYRRTLQSDRRHLLEQFTLVQVARKVVGVGSVGTRAWILLMEAGDGAEPLFLQAKEAQPSVLADYCGRSQYANQGERVVAGQHLMQAESDIFLGWTHVPGPDGVDRDFYVRQLKDWKFSFPIEQMIPSGMTVYARLCGWTLARAHARSGDRIALAAYLGGSDKFDAGDRRLRRNLRRPERTRLRRAPDRRQRRQGRGHHRDLKSPCNPPPHPIPRRTWKSWPGLEHVTMTAEPPESPVTEAVRSLEVRWIFPGQLEAAVAGWFGRFPAGRSHARTPTC